MYTKSLSYKTPKRSSSHSNLLAGTSKRNSAKSNVLNENSHEKSQSIERNKKEKEFFVFSDYIYLISCKSHHDYTHIIRLIYLQFLKTEDIRIKPTSTIDDKMFAKMYCQIIKFIFLTLNVSFEKNTSNFNFQILYKFSLDKNVDIPYFKYGINCILEQDNSNSDSETQITDWQDIEITKYLIRAIMDRYEGLLNFVKTKKASSTKSSKIDLKLFNWLGTMIKCGLQIPRYMNEFLSIADDFLQFILKQSENLSPYLNAISEVFAGLLKAHKINSSATSNFIYTNTVLMADILTKEFKIKVPESSSSFHQNVDFLSSFSDKSKLLKSKNVEKFDKIKSTFRNSLVLAANEALGNVEQKLFRRLQKGEMSDEIALRTTLEQFALSRTQQELMAMKAYKKIFKTLSTENGPWQTVEVENESHRKLMNRTNRFCRFFMKPNTEFDDHKAASIARDIGNVQNAQEIYQKEFAKLKMTPFKGDLALIAADRQTLLKDFKSKDQTYSPDKVILTLDCACVAMMENYTGSLSMIKSSPNMIVFDSPKKYIRLSLNFITKVFLRHYLLLDTAVEIFTKSKKCFIVNPG